MIQNIKTFFSNILNFIIPLRSDFEVVKNLDEKTINSLPKAFPVEEMDWIHSLFHYRDNRVRAIIWELKYKKNFLSLDYIGKLLYEEVMALMSDIILFDSDAKFLLIPIPISNERKSERGYNQSEYVAKAILDYDSEHILLYAPQWFEKIKETQRQSHSQSKAERQQNLTGCFRTDPRVEGKYVILIDDVVTTGSTLSEARKILLDSNARDVFAFTIAH